MKLIDMVLNPSVVSQFEVYKKLPTFDLTPKYYIYEDRAFKCSRTKIGLANNAIPVNRYPYNFLKSG